MQLDQFVLDQAFNETDTKGGPVCWRDCALRPNMNPGEQSYIIVWPDGNHLHTYHYPPNRVEGSQCTNSTEHANIAG